jgi:hypothetical protein
MEPKHVNFGDLTSYLSYSPSSQRKINKEKEKEAITNKGPKTNL